MVCNSIHLILQNHSEEEIIILTLKRNKKPESEISCLSHMAHKWKGRGSNTSGFDFKPTLLQCTEESGISSCLYIKSYCELTKMCQENPSFVI